MVYMYLSVTKTLRYYNAIYCYLMVWTLEDLNNTQRGDVVKLEYSALLRCRDKNINCDDIK